jgi:hypothetical protein
MNAKKSVTPAKKSVTSKRVSKLERAKQLIPQFLKNKNYLTPQDIGKILQKTEVNKSIFKKFLIEQGIHFSIHLSPKEALKLELLHAERNGILNFYYVNTIARAFGINGTEAKKIYQELHRERAKKLSIKK